MVLVQLGIGNQEHNSPLRRKETADDNKKNDGRSSRKYDTSNSNSGTHHHLVAEVEYKIMNWKGMYITKGRKLN